MRLGTMKYRAIFESSPIVTKQYQSSRLKIVSCFSFIIQPHNTRPNSLEKDAGLFLPNRLVFTSSWYCRVVIGSETRISTLLASNPNRASRDRTANSPARETELGDILSFGASI